MCRKLVVLVLILAFASAASAELLARWTFDGGSYANVGGSVGAAADGTPVGAATIVSDPGYSGFPWNPAKAPSDVLQVTGFDWVTSIGDYVNCGGGGGGWGDIPQPAISMEAWYKVDLTSASGNNFGAVVSKGSGEADGWGITRFGRADDISTQTSSTPGWQGLGSGSAVAWNGEWHHVVGVWVDESITGAEAMAKIYVDGILANTGIRWRPPGIPLNDYDVWIGGSAFYTTGDARFFAGLIDDVRIYDEALTDAQVYQCYLEGLVPEPATIALLGLGGLALLRKRR